MRAKIYGSSGPTKPLHYRRTTRLHELMKMAAMPLLFLLLTAAVRGQSALDGFDPNANGADSRRRRPTGRQDSSRRRFYNALAQRRSGGHAQPHCPAEPGRHARHRLQPERERCCLFNRGAGGRQDFSGRLFPRTASADRRAITSPGSMPRPAWPIRSTRTRTSNVLSIAVQADGKILAGGDFRTASADRRAITSPGSMPRPAWLIRSTRTRTDTVHSIAVQADGKILVGGDFTSIGGQTRNRIARLDATTGLADSFDPNANNDVFSIAVQADGKILAGGFFTEHRRTDAQPHRPARSHDRLG